MTTRRRIQRSVAVAGNLVTVDKPGFVTLVRKPANQRSFGILRSEEEGTVSKPAAKRVARTRRNEGDANLVRITLPGTLDEAGVQSTLTTYGLLGYSVTRSEDDQSWIAQNPSAINCTEQLSTINMLDGVVAHVRRNETTSATEAKGQLTASSFEFNAEQFPDAAAVSAWCQRNSVDFDDKALNNPSGNLVLQRAEVAEGEEIRLMELDEGVTVTVFRSQVGDIPEGFIAVINEYAYSGWGWGQLDFTAALADDQVGDALYDGLYCLEDLLRNILFWSELPVDVKKELTTRACGQFAAYANGLLDTLPRQLLISVATTQRSAKEKDMSTTAKPAATAAATTEAQRSEPAPAPVALTVGSPEFTAAVGEAVAAELKRREDEAAETAAAEVQRTEAETAAATQATEQAAIRRSEIVDAVKAVTEPLLAQIEELKGTTILRTAAADPKLAAQVAQRSEDTVFKGIFGNIGRSAAREPDDAPAAAPAPGEEA